jgi:hypothetical protein
VIDAERELLADRRDVWALVAEPYHLSDWWPGYQGIRPDRRGLAEGARWQVVRGIGPGLVRRPGGQTTIEIVRVVDGYELRWRDFGQRLEAGLQLDNAGIGRTRARAFVDGSWWRLVVEGGRTLPRQALARLYDLCQTAVEL